MIRKHKLYFISIAILTIIAFYFVTDGDLTKVFVEEVEVSNTLGEAIIR